MRNPIHKRLEKFKTWQMQCFMLCLCQRMLPNYQLFASSIERSENAKILQNITALSWENLMVKNSKINFDRQLEKLEEIIFDVNDFDCYGILPAVDATQAISYLLHSIIAGESLDAAINISKLSLKTVREFVEFSEDRILSDEELKDNEMIQSELDVQWQIYRILKDCEDYDLELIKDLRSEIIAENVSNIRISLD